MMRPDHHYILMAAVRFAVMIVVAIYSFKLGRIIYHQITTLN